jgi:hypothetical protein
MSGWDQPGQDWRTSRSIDPAWANPNAPPEFQCEEHLEAFITAIFPGPHRCNPRLDDFLTGKGSSSKE